MSVDNQNPTDQDQQQGTDQTPPEGTDQDQGTDKPQGRQARRDEQARQRAAELQAERDKLAGRVEQLQRREIERLAGEVLAQPGDLLELGKVTLDDLRDADGDIDADAVAKAAAALVETRPGLSVHAEIKRGHKDWGHTRTSDPYFGAGPGYEGEGTASWSDAFGSAGRGGRHYT